MLLVTPPRRESAVLWWVYVCLFCLLVGVFLSIWNGLLCADVPLRNCSLTCLCASISPELHVHGNLHRIFKKCMLPIAIDTSLAALRYVMYFRFMGDIILHMMTKNRRREKFFMIQLCGTYNWPSNVYWWLGVARILDRYSCATLSFVNPQIEFNF